MHALDSGFFIIMSPAEGLHLYSALVFSVCKFKTLFYRGVMGTNYNFANFSKAQIYSVMHGLDIMSGLFEVNTQLALRPLFPSEIGNLTLLQNNVLSYTDTKNMHDSACAPILSV